MHKSDTKSLLFAIICHMKVLTRYLLRNLFVSFLLGLVLYALLFFIQNLFVLSEIIVEKHAPPTLAFQFVGLFLPKILGEVFPFAVLFAGAMTTGQLAGNSELVVINAMGTSIRRQLRPYMIFAVFAFLLYGWFLFSIVPASKIARNRVFNHIAQQAVVHAQQPGTFQEIGDNIYLRFQEATLVNSKRRKLKNVEVYEIKHEQKQIRISEARTGFLSVSESEERLHLRLQHGREYALSFLNGEQSQLRYHEKELTLPTEQFLNTPFPDEARFYKMQSFMDFGRQWLEGNQMVRAIAARRLLLLLFALTGPLLTFALGFKLQRGAGLSGAFLTSFFIGVLVVVGAKMMESSLVNSTHSPELVFVAISFLYCMYLLFLYRKLEHPAKERRQTAQSGMYTLENVSKHLKKMIDIRMVLSGQPGVGKLVQQYVTRGFLRALAMVFIIMEGIYLLFLTLNMIPELLNTKAHIGLILGEMMYSFPASLPYVFPLAFVVSSFFYASLMDDRSEIVALKSVGFSLHNLFSLLLRVGVAGALLLTFINTFIGPLSQKRADLIHERVRNPSGTYTEDQRVFTLFFNNSDSDFHSAYCFVSSVDPANNLIQRPVIALKTVLNGPMIALYSAESIRLQGTEWIVENGKWFTLQHDLRKELKTVPIPLPPSFVQFLQAKPELDRLTSYQLRTLISRRKAEGTTPYPEITAYYARFASAFSPLVLLIMGLPILFIGPGSRRRRPTVGIMMGIALVVAYYALSSLFQSLGAVHYLPPFLAAWMVNFICLIAGMLLITMVRT